MIYESLNDVGKRVPDLERPFAPGDVEVWYMKPSWFRQGIVGENPDPNNLQATHVLLGKVTCIDPEFVWCALQAEAWSPHGEACQLIRSLGLEHTSMSVGDCIRIADGGNEVYIARSLGFERL
jgi:hypothetical protein